MRKYFLSSDEKSQPGEETLETMNTQTLHLYTIIKSQLEDSEHPMNQIVKRFGFYFCQHYSDQILVDDKTLTHYLVKPVRRNEYDIRKVTQE